MRFRQPTSSLIPLLFGLGISTMGCGEGALKADPQLANNPPFGNAEETTLNNTADGQTASQSPDSTPEQFDPKPVAENTAAAPDSQSDNPEFIGPVQPSDLSAAPGTTAASEETSTETLSFSDLSQAPAELIAYIEDLATLELLSPASVVESDNGAEAQADQTRVFQPNQAITRREYARWLASVNNAFHQDNPAEQIRLAVSTAQPAFQDVSTSDPDFPEIQGLAEAGIIPSPLSGSTTTVSFRPDAPLNRADLILWKTPLDTRRGLPIASIDAVEQTWGFQDAAKIDPRALQAVLADFQNGEFANIRRAFGYTTLFQPDKAVTRAEAAAVLWRFGNQTEGISAQNLLPDSQSQNSSSAFFPRR
ncbi:MAG: S-layer homology domain-containing protein [Pseudanabaenales cyanobacterium]|nr:S-layer homology domain-containing protein [Pseudanabaenales cyanobacterium]